MPIYEYHCEECGREFECLIFGGDDAPGCPDCQGNNVNRLLSACGFKSKGSGGETVKSSASACGGCAATSCSTCGH